MTERNLRRLQNRLWVAKYGWIVNVITGLVLFVLLCVFGGWR